jgi:preflagellin peptidase FlaK
VTPGPSLAVALVAEPLQVRDPSSLGALVPDLLRLVAVPVLGWAAYSDIRTRRVPNRTWYPLAGLGVLLLVWDGLRVLSRDPLVQRLFLVQVVVSLGLVAPLGYVFWRLGGFGGADAKALAALAVLFPAYPAYPLPGALAGAQVLALPVVQTPIGVFSLTILSNTVVAGAAYPLAIAVGNAVRGHLSPAMLIGKPIPVDAIPESYGKLLETPDGFTRSGLDLDALRMYLQWRGLTLSEVRANPDRYRDPATLPDDPNPPGDGAVPIDDEAAANAESTADSERPSDDAQSDGGAPADHDDAWGADAFFDDLEYGAYGATPTQLRDGLETLADSEAVWISPGLPFIVPMFVGLLLALTYGDVLFTAMRALGLG